MLETSTGDLPGVQPEVTETDTAAQPAAETTEQEQPTQTETPSTETTDGSEKQEPATGETEIDGTPKKSAAQRRIDSLTRRRYQVEAENAELRRQLDAERAAKRAGSDATQTQTTDSGKPQRDSFATYDDYVEALSKYNATQIIHERDQAARQIAAQQQRQAVVDTWNSNVEKAREKYEDFDDVVGGGPTIPQAAFDAIVDSQIGPDIAYFLGTHPELAESLNKLHPVAAIRAIGAIEARLAPAAQSKPGVAGKAPVVQSKKPVVSAAKAPINPVGSGRVQAAKDPSQMSYQEYKKWREANKS